MKKFFVYIILCSLFFACGPKKEISRSEAERFLKDNHNPILSSCVRLSGGGEYKIGHYGGIWNSVVSSEPKTFNSVRVNDSSTSQLIALTRPYLFDYDSYKKEWKGALADFEVVIDKELDVLEVVCSLKDNLFWYVAATDTKIEITSDDVVYWFEEIVKFEELHMAEYSGTFIELADGSVGEIKAVKIDDRRFKFVYPRIIAEPLLSSNLSFGPMFIYKKAKEEGGYEGVLNLFTIDSDVRAIPSCGPFYFDEYKPGVSLSFKRNPFYHKKDLDGNSLPYIDGIDVRFVSSPATALLLFKKEEIESLSSSASILDGVLRIEDLNDIVEGAENYIVADGGSSLGASFVVWNQNPTNKDKVFYKWFTQKEFRQAMSCFIDKQKIIDNVYRGLGSEKKYFFTRASEFFNEDIVFEYSFNPQKALLLLKSIGIDYADDGFLHDKENNRIEFDFSITADNPTTVDIANIYADTLKQYGIKMNIRVLDYGKMVDSLLYTYDWQSLLIGLSGSNTFPTQGSNVWPSDGNLHMWYPLQKEPATDWEARLDYLYNEGSFTRDKLKAKDIWDEYQSIIWEQVPLSYLVRKRIFFAINKKWDNVVFDYLQPGVDIEYVFLKE